MCFVVTVLFLFLLAQVLASGVDYFVSYWINIEEIRNAPFDRNGTIVTTSIVQPSTETCLYTYGTLIVVLFFSALLRSMLFYKLAMNSSQTLHDSMFSSVIKAPMRFFDTNPAGRILNRYAKDIGATDELLPKAILDAAQVCLLLRLRVYSCHAFFLLSDLALDGRKPDASSSGKSPIPNTCCGYRRSVYDIPRYIPKVFQEHKTPRRDE